MLQNDYQGAKFDGTQREQAKAAARMIGYTIRDAEELNLQECRQLLLLAAALIRKKFELSLEETCSSDEDEDAPRPAQTVAGAGERSRPR